jgi:uncharacterized repeat protein (TIGR01451 family)
MIKIYSYAYFSKQRKKSYLKRISVICTSLLIVQMTIGSLLFTALPQRNAEATSGNICSNAVDAVMIMDRSGSMNYNSRCDWWELKCMDKPACLNYQWVQNTTYDKGESWCTSKDQAHPHEAVWVNFDPKKIVAAKQAANNFIGMMGTGDQSALVSFASTVTLDKQLSNNHALTQSAVNALATNGGTNIGDALRTGFNELKSARANAQAVKTLILLTDGKANLPNGTGSGESASDVHYAEGIAAEIADYGFKIFTIGLGTSNEINEAMLENIANVSGGEYYHSPSQTDLQSIYDSIASKLCAYGSISGCKFSDRDKDGDISDETDKLSDWPIILNNSETLTQLTDENGCYKFSGLQPGTYSINEGVKASTTFIQTFPADKSYSIILTEGQDVYNKDFGNYLPVCGNNRQDDDEQCDDGNLSNGDGCSDQCQTEIAEPACGDGTINGTEQCDDGNVLSGDGCSSQCQTEIIEPVCGDGTKNGTEECDDGNVTSGDGCSDQCLNENSGCVASGSIVINEIMKNPLVTLDKVGEWFEVYNPTGQNIDLMTCIIKDNLTDSHTINTSLVVPAKGYAVLARNGDPAANGGVTANYVYSNFELGNNSDQVIISCCGQIIDNVNYNTVDFPHLPNGSKSMILKDPSLDNNVGANWCESTSAYGLGDLGTPGIMNDRCADDSCTETVEICDGIDNDCDGAVDEGLSTPTACGVGACASSGQRTCIGGQYTDSCTPGTPAEGENCNNQIDDNCNGITDENCGGGSNTFCGNSIVEAGEVCDDGLVNNGNYGFCDSLCSGLTPGAVISGYKYSDPDGLASTTEGRLGMPGWVIQLYGSSSTSTILAATTTASNGFFQFIDLAPGDYSLGEVMKQGWTQIAAPLSTISVLLSQTSANNNFVNFNSGGSGGPSTFCGDGIKQSPNDALLGGPNNDGIEQCDGSSELPAGFVCSQNCILQSTGSSGGESSGGSGGGSSVILLLNNQTNKTGTTTGNTTAVPENPKVLGESGEPKLSLTKKVNVEFANPGDKNIEYRIKIGNVGNLTASEVVLDDVLPEGFIFSDTGKKSKTWKIGDLKAGETKDIVYFVDILDDATPKTYVNTATAKSLNSDPVVARAELTVKPIKVLAASGFDISEFLAITFLMLLLVIASVVFKRRTN